MDISYRPPTPEELQEFRAKLFEDIWELTRQLSDMPAESWPSGPGFGGWTPLERRDAHLALLNAVGVAYALLDMYEKEAAARAGRLGAGYPELAEVWQITRQGARRRWPDAAMNFDDLPLRRALTKVVMTVSNNTSIDPRTAARLIGPVATAATSMVNGTPEEVASAAREIVQSQPPAPPDTALMSPLVEELERALAEYDASTQETTSESSPWSRFLESRNR